MSQRSSGSPRTPVTEDERLLAQVPRERRAFVKTDSWRVLRIMGEFVEGFDTLSDVYNAVTVFGSARTTPDDPYYEKAVETARMLAQEGFPIITGGGPGIMEAANRGAQEGNGLSIGCNIELPFEQGLNPYVERSINFRYFFVRKTMFVKYSTAFIVFPGGYGTMDELFEALTLIQTGKVSNFPVILFGVQYWAGLVEWLKERVAGEGKIASTDLRLFTVTDSPREAVAAVRQARERRSQRIDPKPITGRETIPELVDNAFLAYNSGRLAEGCRLFTELMREDDGTVGMSLTGAMTPAGLGMSTIIPLVEAGFIDWIVSTGANLYHDAHFGLGLTMHRGTPFADDVELREEGVVRIYDIFFDYEVLLSTDAYIREVSAGPEFQRPMSTAEYHYLLGGYILEREKALGISRKSVLGVAHQCAVPIYTSSPGDSSIGMNVAEQALTGSLLRFDPSADVNETSAIVFDAKTHGGKSGILIFGGGSPKNFVLQTEPQIQEVLGISEKGHDYYLQMTDARPDTGGLSGATPAEAVSWGKVDPDKLPDTVVCYLDNTVAFPILAAYALARRKPRRLKRLYDQRPDMMRALTQAYQEAKADRDARAEATTVDRRP